MHCSVIRVRLEIPLPQLNRHLLDQPQITLTSQPLIGDRKRAIQRNCFLAEQTAIQNAVKIANPEPRSCDTIQEDIDVTRVKCGIDERMKLRVTFRVADRYCCLFKHRFPHLFTTCSAFPALTNSGAGDGTRTRDQQLGRL